MVKKKKLFPGIGATGTILTRFVKPNEGLSKEKGHRSTVVLKESYFEGHRLCFRFILDGGDDQKTYYANSRYVKIEKEGSLDDFFFDGDKKRRGNADAIAEATELLSKTKEPDIKWKNSKARQLLYKDLVKGIVPLDPKDQSLDIEDIFSMHIEYAEYRFDLFADRLKSLF
jgi:hypothetical protein